jgi:quercetin dioxygenase-like cupin family protein
LERFGFGPEAAFAPRQDDVVDVTIAPLTPPTFLGVPFQAAVFRFAPGGRIARHPTSMPTILAVLEGSGHVTGASGVAEPIAASEAVFWELGEEHEITSVDGLTALIVEGDGLEPYRRSA